MPGSGFLASQVSISLVNTPVVAPVSAVPPPSPETARSLSLLATLPGLDTAQGLAAIRGQADKYLRLLRRFAESHRGDMAAVRDLVATRQFDAARQLTHALKGVAATLGASPVAKQAAALEASLKQGAASEPLVTAVEAELSPLVAAILALPEASAALGFSNQNPISR